MNSISPTRWVLGLVGVAGMVWGVVSLLDDPLAALISVAIWLAAAVIIHDGVMAPLSLGIFGVGTRVLPPAARKPVALAFLVWATCTVTFVAVLSGQGGKAGNDTILGRPYLLSWAVLTLVLAAVAALATVVRTRRFAGGSAGYDLSHDRPATPPPPQEPR